LDQIRQEIVKAACAHMGCQPPADAGDFLDSIHKRVSVDEVNALRLAVYRAINRHSWFRPTYFRIAQPYVEALVGNELAVQNRVNLSIQMPGDQSSVLDIHSDAFGGETPIEAVVWLPLVDVFSTKSMYYLPRKLSKRVEKELNEYRELGMAGLFNALRNQV